MCNKSCCLLLCILCFWNTLVIEIRTQADEGLSKHKGSYNDLHAAVLPLSRTVLDRRCPHLDAVVCCMRVLCCSTDVGLMGQCAVDRQGNRPWLFPHISMADSGREIAHLYGICCGPVHLAFHFSAVTETETS